MPSVIELGGKRAGVAGGGNGPSRPAVVAQEERMQRNAPGDVAGCIVLHNWESSLANLAASNLKRSRTLPNCSREDRIRDWQLKRRR